MNKNEKAKRLCATAALGDFCDGFINVPEDVRKLSGSKTVPEGPWPAQRLGASDGK